MNEKRDRPTILISDECAESIRSMDPEDPERFAVVATPLKCWGPHRHVKDPTRGNQGGFGISWRTKAAGFGHTTIWIEDDGRLMCDDEGMGREFIVDVLKHLANQLEIRP